MPGYPSPAQIAAFVRLTVAFLALAALAKFMPAAAHGGERTPMGSPVTIGGAQR